MTSPLDGILFCCDSDALIAFEKARLIRDLNVFAELRRIRIPLGVYNEVRAYRGVSTTLKNAVERWKDLGLVVDLDQDADARRLLPEIETRYGEPFSMGGVTYRGLWNSKAGRNAADGEVVAFAKARGWTVISNDVSVHGACYRERIVCHRWEHLARVISDHLGFAATTK